MSQSLSKTIFQITVILSGVWIAFVLAAHLIGEIFWFKELNYLPVFIKRLSWQLGLWLFGSGISALFLLGNIRTARRLKWHSPPKLKNQNQESLPASLETSLPTPFSPALGLSLLLPIVFGCSLIIGLILVFLTQTAFNDWQNAFSLFATKPSVAFPFNFQFFSPQIRAEVFNHIWEIGAVLGVTILVLVNSQFWVSVISCAISLVFGTLLSGNWTTVLLFLNPTKFNQADPILKNDLSFYMFGLEAIELLVFWLVGLFFYGLIAVSLIYLLSANSISEGRFPGFSYLQLRHLYALGGGMMIAVALYHWLRRYQLLYSSQGVVYGAGYTNVQVNLPLEKILSLIAVAIAVWLLLKARGIFEKKRRFSRVAKTKFKYIPALALPFSAYGITIIAGLVIITAVQRLDVQPNELQRERPYIENSIALSRAGFNLDKIEVNTFNPEGELTAADIRKNYLTIDNIRLWDTRPLLETNRQLQQIRLYYKFPNANIDRYVLKIEQDKDAIFSPQSVQSASAIARKQQVIISARELDYSAVPKRAKTWVNQHLIYTHGYGFTLSPVNRVAEGGLPEYFVKDIGTEIQAGTLNTSSESIRESIPIAKPRIYYGQLTDTYVMTNTKVGELDFPSGEDNVYNTYDGTGGIGIGSPWQRLFYAGYLKDWRMMFTRNFTQDTRLLFRRDINSRIQAIAPFLRFDRDPYLVVGDAGDARQGGAENYLHWIIDAYTIGDRYPYSDPGNNQFNYVRNSVKIVLDAYNGDVDFYIAEPEDPVVQSWNKIFPQLFKPIDTMPESLRSHIRYPEDIFSIQSERLLTYHMTDPQVFYNREDQWQIAREIYRTELQPVEPYYSIVKLPTATSEEFILIHLYTPASRGNTIAGLFGLSDGKNYGKLLLYQFPKQKLVYGPEQIEARINQDPVISQRIALWNREASRVIQGNLLVIPIENSLLYVEPLYLEAEKNTLPTLVRTIVVYKDRIVMAETLEQALQAIFEPGKEPTPAIIRPLDNIPPAGEAGGAGGAFDF